MTDEPVKADKERPPLPIEETPIINPSSGEVAQELQDAMTSDAQEREDVVSEAARVFQSSSPEMTQISPETPVTLPPIPKKIGGNRVGTVLFIILLFGLGVWLSSQFRSFFAPPIRDELVVPTVSPSENINPTPARESSPSGTTAASFWQTYEVISGSTKKPVFGAMYKLPSNVNAPICDSQSCASQGTNLPGGTRFTVAARGKGQVLPDFRGAILTDAAGREFTMKQGVFGGAYAYEYTGDFIGRTGGGYTFTQIRGVLMPVSETLSIEFNHFSPAGITTDFAKDDMVFDEIIQSFTATGISVASPTARPTISAPTTTPVVSPSGN